MSIFNLLWAAFCGAGAAAGLSFCSNISRYDIAWGAMVGGLGWLTYTLLIPESGIAGTESFFWGAMVVAVLSEVLAFIVKNPATVYLVPGLLPLVPGGGMFQTMRAVVTGDLEKALSIGFTTLTAAGAIALAVALASSLTRIIKSIYRHHKTTD